MTSIENINVGRRGFLRGRMGQGPLPLRPPWAIVESDFVAGCTRCGDCVPICPTGIVTLGDGGFPTIDFTRGECSFCAACVTACQPAVLRRTADEAPWRIHAVIGDACLARANVVCRSCGDVCEAGAIRFQPRLAAASLPEVDSARCSGCGACVAPCPAAAISMGGKTSQQPGGRT